MKPFSETYIERARLIGALYCIIPSMAWFVGLLCAAPFRWVYVLRVALSVIFGGIVAAGLHRYGVKLWLLKHRSSQGPATPADGALIGAAVGLGVQILPALTYFIGTNHPEDAKTGVIVVWLASMVVGAAVGAIVTSLLGRQVGRAPENA